MDRVTTATSTAAYTTAGATVGLNWLHALLSEFNSHEWQAIGTIVGILFAAGTFLINWHYQRKNSNKKDKCNGK